MTEQADLEEVLRQLEREERDVSARRSTLHERLATFPNPVIEEQERRLSERRRQLHTEIEQIRARIKAGE